MKFIIIKILFVKRPSSFWVIGKLYTLNKKPKKKKSKTETRATKLIVYNSACTLWQAMQREIVSKLLQFFYTFFVGKKPDSLAHFSGPNVRESLHRIFLVSGSVNGGLFLYRIEKTINFHFQRRHRRC